MLSLAAISDPLLPDHDAHVPTHIPCMGRGLCGDVPPGGAAARPAWARALGTRLEGLVVWDGVWFAHIATCGYEYEQSHAFFPLFPLCVRLVAATVVRPAWRLIGCRASVALAGHLVSNACFMAAALLLYRGQAGR